MYRNNLCPKWTFRAHGVSLFFFFLLFVTPAFPQLTFTSSFTPSTIGPGSSTSLRFQIDNTGSTPIDNIQFSNNLPTGLNIASAGVLTSDCNGILIAPNGGSSISISGVRLGGNTGCFIEVNVTASSTGNITNTTGDLTSDIGNSGNTFAVLNVATDRVGISLQASNTNLIIGERSTLTLLFDNTLNTLPVEPFFYSFSLPINLDFATTPNLTTDCNDWFVPSTIEIVGKTLTISNAGVNDGTSCTITVDVAPNNAGNIDLVTPDLFFGSNINAGFATVNLQSSREFLRKEFLNDPVIPGETVDLEFTLINFDRGNSATNINFTDDLDAVLSGLVAASLPANGFCGAGSTISGSSVLSISGASLNAQETCSFIVQVQVPSTSPSGTYENNTSEVDYTLADIQITGNIGRDELLVQAAPQLTKTFLNNPANPGDVVSLEFTIDNTGTDDMTDIAFSDVFTSLNMELDALPANGFCGASSTITYIPLFNPPPPFRCNSS